MTVELRKSPEASPKRPPSKFLKNPSWFDIRAVGAVADALTQEGLADFSWRSRQGRFDTPWGYVLTDRTKADGTDTRGGIKAAELLASGVLAEWRRNAENGRGFTSTEVQEFVLQAVRDHRDAFSAIIGYFRSPTEEERKRLSKKRKIKAAPILGVVVENW